MANKDTVDRRVKFHGVNDYGTYFYAGRAAEILERYKPSPTPRTISDILELYNAQLFAESGLFPKTYSDRQCEACQALIPELRRVIAKFFAAINEANIASVIVEVDYTYHADLLNLLSRYKVYDRCTAPTVLAVLEKARIDMGSILTSRSIVRSYDQEVRARLVSNPLNAEHLIRKHLEKDADHLTYLPSSFTPADARKLLDDYLDSGDANPNFVRLVAAARVDKEAGIDAKLKLKAKRKHDAWMADFFKNNTGAKSGCEVSLSENQTEPVVASLEGLFARFSYSQRWFEDNLDFPTILNSFLYLFEFTKQNMLLALPSYKAELGVFERFMGIRGKDAYSVGAAFQLKQQSSFLQTVLYDQFLQTKDIELECVIAWFFAEYLKEEFGATKLKFAPSSKMSSYLERSRHLFSEMESVIKQFSLYVENGELDTDLLAMTSEQVRYKTIPSFLTGKYVYVSDNRDIHRILHLLFSDQSGLTYINENLRDYDAARLLVKNQVTYSDFAEHQKRDVDYLIGLGVLENTSTRVEIADIKQALIFKAIFDAEATSYYHYPAESRSRIDDMVSTGWLIRRQSLLTDSEGSYFNYFLNQAEFSNGPDLRNKYLHGSQADANDTEEHFRTYITALKLLIALVIKINDDFWLRDGEKLNAGRN